MKRNEFIKSTGLMGLAIAVNPAKLLAGRQKQQILKPAKLNPGDKVGLVVPASFITEKQLEEAKRNIENLGLVPYYTNNVLARDGYLGGTDKQRADDINAMFSDKSIKAVWSVRGGYGCARMLDMLDYDLIKKNPKILIGYSDITALLYAIFARTGLVTFHGPVATSTFDDFSVSYLKSLLFEVNSNVKLVQSPVAEEPLVIRSGKASGRLVGGNLSIVVSLIGTKYDVDSRDKIIFLEEIKEEPYRIDRMLTQMIQAGKFDGAKAVVLGNFRKCDIRKNDPEFDESFTLSEVLYDRLFNLGIPVIYGMSFGHIDNKFTLPFGVKAELNTLDASVVLKENPVV